MNTILKKQLFTLSFFFLMLTTQGQTKYFTILGNTQLQENTFYLKLIERSGDSELWFYENITGKSEGYSVKLVKEG